LPAHAAFSNFLPVKPWVKILSLCTVTGIFVFGGVNLYPCAAGAETAQEAKNSCHAKPAHKNHGSKEQKKSEKPCCSLHCYNPAHIEPLVKMAAPAVATIIIRNEEIPFTSLTISPPLPPPRRL
jgi:hypothetical protein